MEINHIHLISYHITILFRDSSCKALKMPILIFHIFDRDGKCLYEKEWVRNKQSSLPKDQELKLMFGMIHSINSFVGKISPSDFKDGFLSFSTNKYKLHYFESSTGIKFILITDVGIPNAQDTLMKIYSKVRLSTL